MAVIRSRYRPGLGRSDYGAGNQFKRHQREQTNAHTRCEHGLTENVNPAMHRCPEGGTPVVAALMSLRGVVLLTAATLVAELGELHRFETAAKSEPTTLPFRH
jgi:hypothetical protein